MKWRLSWTKNRGYCPEEDVYKRQVFNPATAVVEVDKELKRMATLASDNLNRAMNSDVYKRQAMVR